MQPVWRLSEQRCSLVTATHPSCHCCCPTLNTYPTYPPTHPKPCTGNDDLEFKRANGKVTITDAQGNTINVAGKPVHPDDNKTVIPIDGVLFGSEWPSGFCGDSGSYVNPACGTAHSSPPFLKNPDGQQHAWKHLQPS